MIEDKMVDSLTPMQVKYLRPVLPNGAHGELQEVYRQIRNDFQVVPPLTLLSQCPRILAGVWSIVRESQLVSDVVDRHMKEAVAAAASSANSCSYCVDAHLGLLEALEGKAVVDAVLRRDLEYISDRHLRELVEWGLSLRDPGKEVLRRPPFSVEEEPEIVGTAMAYQFVNRMALIFLPESPLPVSISTSWFRRFGISSFALIASPMAKKAAVAGESLKFFSDNSDIVSFSWAKLNPRIDSSFRGFAAAMEEAGARLPVRSKEAFMQELERWNGERVSQEEIGRADNFRLDDTEMASYQLLIRTALSPESVDDKAIARFRKYFADDKALLETTSFAGYAVMRRMSRWVCREG